MMTGTDSGLPQAEPHGRARLINKKIICAISAVILFFAVFCIVLFVKLINTEKQLEQLRMEARIQETQAAAEEIAQTSIFVVAPLEESPRNRRTETAGQVSEEEDVTRIYLTFDDGPSSNTNAILDVLKKYDVKATFFVVGKTDGQSQMAYKRIVEEGHTLGMHSYSHKYREIYRSVEAFSADLTELQEYLYEETGVWCRYYRFPGGSSNTVSKVDMQELIAYLNKQDITYFDWNISSGDAARDIVNSDGIVVSHTVSSPQIVNNCLGGVAREREGIVLLHDTAEKRSTVEALPQIIEGILAMKNAKILPISDDTVPIQHITEN